MKTWSPSDKQVEALRACAIGDPWAGIARGSGTGFGKCGRARTYASLEDRELVEARYQRGSRLPSGWALTDSGVMYVEATQDRMICSRHEELRTSKMALDALRSEP